MKVEHTPGPWKWYWCQENDETNCGVNWSSFSGITYSICRAPRYETQAQWEANARLIATAPELLEALERAVDTIEWLRVASSPAEDEIEQAIASAQAIIHKARGKDE